MDKPNTTLLMLLRSNTVEASGGGGGEKQVGDAAPPLASERSAAVRTATWLPTTGELESVDGASS